MIAFNNDGIAIEPHGPAAPDWLEGVKLGPVLKVLDLQHAGARCQACNHRAAVLTMSSLMDLDLCRACADMIEAFFADV